MFSKHFNLIFRSIPRSLTMTAVAIVIVFCGFYLSTPNLHAKGQIDPQMGINSNGMLQIDPPSLSQPNFRIRADDSAPLNSNSGWAAPLNTAATIDAETPFRIRFEIEETAGGPFNNDFKIQWRKGSGNWNDAQEYDPATASATEAVGVIFSEQYSDGDLTSDLLNGSTAVFTPGTGEEDNDSGTIALTNQHTEFEWNLIIHTFYDGAAQNVSGDTFEFRLIETNNTPLDGVYNNPAVTLNVPDGLIGGTYVENPNRIGPFVDSNGALYTVIEPSETNNLFLIIKSTDGGNTWTEVDSVNRPFTNDLEGVDVVQVGDSLHIAHLPNDSVVYHRLRMSDHPTAPDSWEITDEIVSASISQSDQAAALEVRSDGTVVIFYRRTASAQKIRYKIRSVSGTWGPENELDANIDPNDTTWVTVVRGANDKIHIFYYDAEGPALYHKSLSDTNVLSGRELVTTDVGFSSHEQMSIIPPLYWDEFGAEKIMVGFKGADDMIYTSIITNDGSPSEPELASDNTVNFNSGASRAPTASLAGFGSNIYLHYADLATGDIFRDIYTNGSGWGTDVEEVDDATGHWLRSKAFTHHPSNGGSRVIGYIWDNGSAGYTGYIRYGEYILPPVNISAGSGIIQNTSGSLIIPVTVEIQSNQLVKQISLNVQYDNAVITATSSDPDPDGNFSNATCTVDTSPPRNTVEIDNFEDSGVSGQIILCEVNFDALTPGVSPLTISVNALTDENGQPLSYTLSQGQIIVNSAPTANDDQVNTTMDTAVDIDVTANDDDPDGNLDFGSTNTGCGSCSQPTSGVLVNHGDGSFTYTPDNGFVGSDNFVYQICDTESLCDTASVFIMVVEAGETVIQVQVSSGADDAEEKPSGTISLGSSDLELVRDNGENQTIGLRFNGLSIPPGAIITNATIQFQADETNSGTTSLTIEAEAVDNAAPFTAAVGNISSRPRTSSNVSWSPPPWSTVGEAGPDQQTTNIATVIQEIVNRPGWTEGNSLVLIITGSGKRVAEAYNGVPAAAAQLEIEFSTEAGNNPPVAANDSASTLEDTPVTVDVASNDSDPDGNLDPTTTNTDCGTCAAPTNGSLVNNGDGSFDYSPDPGFSGSDNFVYEICDTGSLCDTAVVNLTVSSTGSTLIEVRVSASADDAEESITGSMSLTSTDLEMVYESGQSAQKVGMRFNNVTIPQGATIVNATVQFQTDETTTEQTDLTVSAHDIDDAPIFNFETNNISNRPLTSAAVSWSPPAWNTVGEAGPDQQSTNIAAVIQEIVNRPGWTEGNSLVLIITGSGKRVAESFNGNQTAAPLLQIEYSSAASNDPPVAVNDSASTLENTPVTVDVASNDSDPDGNLDPTTAKTDCGTCAAPTNGSLVNNGDGSFDYSPDPGFSGSDSFVYEICDTGSLCDTAMVNLTVSSTGSTLIEVRVSASADDAEEGETGDMSITSSDLELVTDLTPGVQKVGMRFNNVTIPQGATIVNATIQFQTDENTTEQTDLMIRAEANDNAPIFVNSTNNISNRPLTSAAVSWSPPAWNTVGEAGPDQQSTNIAAVIQEIVNRPGWTGGNSLVLIITGSGKRVAEAYDGNQTAAPLLQIEYSSAASNDPPVAVDDSASTLENTPVTVDVASNDSDPDGNLDPATANTNCGACAAPTNGSLVNNGDGSFDYSPDPGFSGSDSFVYEICDTGGLCDTAVVNLTVSPLVITLVEVRVSASADDAEESETGDMSMTSSDLELVTDFTPGVQKVGMRFNNVTIPQGATIVNATIQFQTDETTSGQTDLMIRAEANDNAPIFVNSTNNISNRPLTSAAVSWSPAPWLTLGEAGPNQQTPDITTVIQEIVNRPGWTDGSSLVIIITGSGKRVAESYDGKQTAAPLLNIEYTTP